MKLLALTLPFLILVSQFQICLDQNDGFLPKTEEPEQQIIEEESQQKQTTFERVVNFEKFTMELTTKNKTFIQKIQLIPMQSTNTGSVFFNLKNNSENHRGWKISLNKGQGYDLQNINAQQLKILHKIFKKNIGKLVVRKSLLSKIMLYQPQENDYCSYEVSQLKNKCWRIDVYPKYNRRDGYKYVAHLKMCALNDEGQKKFRKFSYLLNNKSLGKTSKE